MKIYSILVHPNKQSLNATMFKLANDLFESQNYTVQTLNLFDVKDKLYEISNQLYNSSASLLDRRYQSAFHYNYSKMTQQHTSNFANEQLIKLKEADLLYIQTPIMVWNIPSLLKLYIETVFLPDAVFSSEQPWSPEFTHNGLLTGRRVIFSFVMGASKEYCEYIMGGVNFMTRPIESIFKLAGYEWIEPNLTWGTSKTQIDKNDEYLINLRYHLSNIILSPSSTNIQV